VKILYLLLSVAVYVLLSYTPGIKVIAFPIEMLCTFLHEFGHAFFGLITGGSVNSLCVNPDGSGVTTISGGNVPLLTMGGYVGSAVFGNVMLRMGTENRAAISLKVLAALMLISSIFWFDNLVTTGILIVFAVGLLAISRWGSKLCPFIISFLGVASVVYIVQDFNVGPTSDLQSYESEVGLFPAGVWMYIWLAIVIVITGINLLSLLKNKTNYESKIS
jgi:hypothetical protein